MKVYSTVLATSASATADLLDAFVPGAQLGVEEVLDIDEDACRHGILDARLYHSKVVPVAR